MLNGIQERIDEVARIAVKIEDATQLPAKLLMAQWAVESSWGAKPCGKANYFGIKKARRHAQSCIVTTHEVVHGKEITCDLEFADYDSLEDSCNDYAFLITAGKPYREAWSTYLQDRNLRGLAFNVGIVYATGLRYAQLVAQIAEQGNIDLAIAKARPPLPEAA